MNIIYIYITKRLCCCFTGVGKAIPVALVTFLTTLLTPPLLVPSSDEKGGGFDEKHIHP